VAFFIRKLAEKNQRRGKKGGGGARTGGRGARVSRGSEVLKIRRGEGSRAWRARRWSLQEKSMLRCMRAWSGKRTRNRAGNFSVEKEKGGPA
jgi:hypothetical protein